MESTPCTLRGLMGDLPKCLLIAEFSKDTQKRSVKQGLASQFSALICAWRRRICYEAARCEILITARMDSVLVLLVDLAMWRFDGIP